MEITIAKLCHFYSLDAISATRYNVFHLMHVIVDNGVMVVVHCLLEALKGRVGKNWKMVPQTGRREEQSS